MALAVLVRAQTTHAARTHATLPPRARSMPRSPPHIHTSHLVTWPSAFPPYPLPFRWSATLRT
eukprot:scaffold64521_cov54-Phaeocystis_antarctica.AAC.1